MYEKSNFFALAFVSFSISCKKDETPDLGDTNSSKNNYTPMTVGIYWIYETFREIPDGSTELADVHDSISIK